MSKENIEGGEKKRRTKFDDGNDYMSMSFVTEKKAIKKRKAITQPIIINHHHHPKPTLESSSQESLSTYPYLHHQIGILTPNYVTTSSQQSTTLTSPSSISIPPPPPPPPPPSLLQPPPPPMPSSFSSSPIKEESNKSEKEVEKNHESLEFVIVQNDTESIICTEKNKAIQEKERRKLQRLQELEDNLSNLISTNENQLIEVSNEPIPFSSNPQLQSQQSTTTSPSPKTTPITPYVDAEAQSKAYMEYQQMYYQWCVQQQQQQQQQYLQQYYQSLSVTNPRVGDPALRRFYGLADD